MYVQPASSDNGTALGAACLLAIKDNQKIFDILAFSDQALFTFNRFSRKAELRLTTKHSKK